MDEDKHARYMKIRSRKRMIAISPRMLYDLLKLKDEDIGEYAGGTYDFDTDTFKIKVMHEKYSEVEQGDLIPHLLLISKSDGTISVE